MPVDFSKIRQLREDRGLTMQEAAERAGFNTRQRWWEYESGMRKRIYLDTLEKIAAALGVSARELISDKPAA